MVDITGEVRRLIRECGTGSGVCHLFVPHTTAGITINENTDPDVSRDVVHEVNRLVPFEGDYRHSEGNSAAHIKSSLFGPSLVCPVEEGRLLLGTWQAIYFCEFDGPRRRRLFVKTVGAA
jgi:secondary thiamine-phosphate synthase enzyme